MSVPFPTQDTQATPFYPLGAPLIQGGHDYLPVPSPSPNANQRPRHSSQNSYNDGHHHTSTSRSRHHSRSDSHEQHHHHSSTHHHHRSQSRDRTNSHGHHARSHSRTRHHSSSGKGQGQGPVIVVPAPQLTSHYSEPYAQQHHAPYGYAPPMAASNTYPVSSPYASSFAQPQMHGAPVYAGSQVPAYAGSTQQVPVYAGSSTHGAYGSLGSSYQPPRSMPMAEPAQSVPRDMHLRSHRRTYSQPTQQQPTVVRPSANLQQSHKHHHTFMHPLFKLSRCTGRKKAVCIGVNYTGTKEALEGCVNDAKNMYHFLVDRGYPKQDILYLVDTSNDPRSRPTRENMIAAMKWLVKDAHEDDALFFHYSGHGGQVRDKDGDEADGMDEVIFPVDYKTAGVIVDDLLHEILVRPLPPGCRLTALFDSCHSGSILDLPYLYHSNGRMKGSDVTTAFKKLRMTPADVITWSGSADSQTSADTYQNGLAVGAMSHAFVKILKRNPSISYQDLLKGVREVLKAKYSQKPQLSSSHRINTSSRFII